MWEQLWTFICKNMRKWWSNRISNTFSTGLWNLHFAESTLDSLFGLQEVHRAVGLATLSLQRLKASSGIFRIDRLFNLHHCHVFSMQFWLYVWTVWKSLDIETFWFLCEEYFKIFLMLMFCKRMRKETVLLNAFAKLHCFASMSAPRR